MNGTSIYKMTKSDLLTHSAISPEYVPTPAKPGLKRTVATPAQIAQWAYDINDSIHTFTSDDTTSILSTFKNNIKTKFDLSLLNDAVATLGIHIMDILKRDLSVDQIKQFTAWEDNLPIYV